MKKVFITIITIASLFSCSLNRKPVVTQAHKIVQNGIDSVYNWIDQDFLKLVDSNAPADEVVKSFERGRKKYKKIEFAIEYFLPSTARGINGPPLPEIEAEEHTVIEPGGFQVIEEFLYPSDGNYGDVKRESIKLRSLLQRTRVLWESMQFREDQLFEALRLEMFRIITLGISGFDTPASFVAIQEIPVSLSGVQDILLLYDRDKTSPLLVGIKSASEFAQNNSDFNSFDRIQFVTRFINPIIQNLLYLQNDLKIPVAPGSLGIRSGLASLFEKDAFNINYFVPDNDSYLSREKISLGKKLFFDTRISANGAVSCATCHQPGKAFTDGLAKNRTLTGNGFLKRNTPTLLNAGYQRSQFYDMRAVYLEDQVKNVIENKDEIHGNLQDAVRIFQKDTSYVRDFRSAFNRDINERDVRIALASYVRSLNSFDSRFDRYMRGDTSTLDSGEKQGFNLFMGRAKCGTCHFMPLFNGTVPPAFTFTESEVIGVPADASGKKIDSDPGRFEIYQIENFRNAFKTPTVRNISLTAPYMHNGVYDSLEEVMDFYNRGGGAGLGLDVPNQTLPFDSLALTNMEIKQVIAFMNSLSEIK